MLVEDIVVRARELSKPHLREVNQFIGKSTTEQLWAYNPHNVDDPRHAEVEAQLKDKRSKTDGQYRTVFQLRRRRTLGSQL